MIIFDLYQDCKLTGLDAVFVCENVFVTLVGVVVPRPCVGESLCLRTVFGADVVVYLVVIAFRVERRINVTKINRLVADKLSQNIQVIAVVEFVHLVLAGTAMVVTGFFNHLTRQSLIFQESRRWRLSIPVGFHVIEQLCPKISCDHRRVRIVTQLFSQNKIYTVTFAKNNCTKLAKQLYQTTQNQRPIATFNCTNPGPEFPK